MPEPDVTSTLASEAEQAASFAKAMAELEVELDAYQQYLVDEMVKQAGGVKVPVRRATKEAPEASDKKATARARGDTGVPANNPRQGGRQLKIQVRDVEKGVRVSPKFLSRKRYFQTWLDCMSMYEKEIPGDWPFWYGERPLVGFLTAAIWSSGGITIEEYQTSKTTDKKATRKAKNTYLGRGDLYFSQGDSEGKAEFKMHNLGISKTDHFRDFLKAKWPKSKEDAWKGRQRGVPNFGGMFLRPYVGIDTDIGRYERNLKSFLKLAWKDIQPDVLAWWCPVARVMAADEPKEKKDWVVGVILLMKQVTRQPVP